MRGINDDQDEILKHLTQVEKELDLLLSNFITGASDLSEFYANPLSTSNLDLDSDSLYDKRLTRQQVFQKAFQIEQAADEMSRELQSSERALDQIQASQAKKQDAGI